MSTWQDARFVRYDYIYYDTSRCAVRVPQWLKFHVIPCVSMEGVCFFLCIDWLGNWLVHLFDWLVGLLVDRLIGELFGCLIAWWVWLINWVILIHGFFFGWIHWLIGFCSIFWLVDCSQHYEWFHETPCVQNHFRELFAHWSTRKRMGLNVHLTCKRFLYFTFNQREMYLPIPSNETT